MAHAADDQRLIRLSEIALVLPEATRKIYGSHAQFLVRKKAFANPIWCQHDPRSWKTKSKQVVLNRLDAGCNRNHRRQTDSTLNKLIENLHFGRSPFASGFPVIQAQPSGQESR